MACELPGHPIPLARIAVTSPPRSGGRLAREGSTALDSYFAGVPEKLRERVLKQPRLWDLSRALKGSAP